MKATIILSTSLIAVGMAVLQTGCESKKKAEEQYQTDSLRDAKATYDTTFKSQEITETILAKSEQHFDSAVKDLDQKEFKKAGTQISEGIAALRIEGAQDTGELKASFEKSVKHLESLQTLALDGKLTSSELKKGFWPAEMMVSHYAIEKWENMPELEAKTNDHLRETLDGLERKTADTEAATKTEGQKLIDETRAKLKAAEQSADTDAQKAKQDLKAQTAKLKAYIKRNI